MFNRFSFGRPAIFFDAPDDSGGGGNPSATNSSTNPAASQSPNAGANGGTSYTQEQLDQMFADRARRGEEAAKKALYESLGVKDDTEFQAYLKTKKAAEDANKTELQKAQDDLAGAKKAAEAKEAAHKQEVESLNKRLLDTEIKQLAGRPATDKDGKVTRQAFRTEAIDDIPLLIAREGIAEKDGKYTGIEEALASLAKAKPHWLSDGQQTQKLAKGTPLQGAKTTQTQTGNETKTPQYVTSL